MQKDPVEHFYNEKYSDGKDYDDPKPQTLLEKMHRKFRKYELHRIDAVVMLLSKNNRLLDIGCGFGELLHKAHDKKNFSELYGVDVSPTVIKQCKNNLKELNAKINLNVHNFDSPSNFKENYFDAITIIAVLEHVFSPIFVLKEINRILKSGGELIIEVPNVTFLPRRICFLLGILPKTSDESLYTDGHLQFFTQASLEKLLINLGFKVTYKGSSGILWKVRNLWPSLLSANIVMKAVKK